MRSLLHSRMRWETLRRRINRTVCGRPVSSTGRLLRGACTLAMIAAPFCTSQTNAATMPAQRLSFNEVMLKIAQEEDLAEGNITYSISGPCGQGSFKTTYLKEGSSGPEDDAIITGLPPPFPGEVLITMMDGDCYSRLDPATTDPQSGTCPPVTVHFGPGAVVDIEEGTQWTSTASGGFSSKTKKWELVVNEGKGDIPAGRYTSSFSYGGAPEIEFIEIDLNPPIDPPVEPNEPYEPPADPNVPIEPNIPTPTIKPPVNPDPNYRKKDPKWGNLNWGTYNIKDVVYLQNYVDWNTNGSFNSSDVGVYCLLYSYNANDGFDNFWDLVDKKKTSSRIYSLVDNQEIIMEGKLSSPLTELRLGFNNNINFTQPITQKILVSMPVGLPDSFKDKTLTYWEYTGEETSSSASATNPYTEGPIYDVKYYARAYPQGQNGVMIERTLSGEYQAVFKKARLSSARKLGDIVWDDKIDSNDYNLAITCIGPNSGVANVAGKERIAGRPSPDGLVDEHDLWAIYNLMPESEKSSVLSPDKIIAGLKNTLGEKEFDLYMSPEHQVNSLLQMSKDKPAYLKTSSYDNSIISK